MFKLRVFSFTFIGLILVGLIAPVTTSAADEYLYARVPGGLISAMEELLGDYSEAEELALATFNEEEMDGIVTSGSATVICRNPTGNNCEELYYPRQVAAGGPLSSDGTKRVYLNLNALTDTGYSDSAIHVPVDNSATGQIIPLNGSPRTIRISNPSGYSAAEINPCTGSAVCDDPADDPAADPENPPDCREEIGGALAWAICAGVDWVDSSIEGLINTLNGLLSVGPSEVNTDEMREAWSFFRNLASLLLVVIGLIMIIGQAGSKE